jgi:hypothetical protein
VNEPHTQWLTITNIVLGLVVAISLIAMIGGMVQEIASRIRRRRFEAEIERDMRAFEVPGFGTTMADGGEKLPPRKKNRR